MEKKQDTQKRYLQLFKPRQHKKMNVSASFLINDGLRRVLWMTIVLPNFPERKVGGTKGSSRKMSRIEKTPL